MILFSTILSINKWLTKEGFIKLVIEWNQTSPHSENVIPNLVWKGEKNIRFGDENLWLDIEEYRNKNIIAVRYEKCEADGIVWDTDYVMDFDNRKMSVRLDRSYTPDALMINPSFSTPHFITLLIERGYLEDDYDLPVLRTPIMVSESDLDLLSEIVKGKKHYRLPIVYISKTYNNEDPVNVNYLAGKLKGVAHVLVQENKDTNYKLRELCNGYNEYYGAIGIYYPNQTLGHRKYLYRSTIGYDSFLMGKVISIVIQYNNRQRVDILYTWQGVNNALLRDRLQSQREERIAAEKAKEKAEEDNIRILENFDEKERTIRAKAYDDAKSEANDLLDGFEEDMRRLQKQIDDLTRANEALQYENQGLKSKLDFEDNIPLLYMGDEYEFYEGEIKDLLLSVLSDAMSGLNPKSRRMDIVKDLIRNNSFDKLSEKKAEEIKRILKNYTGMTAPLRQDLERLGFSITEEGKHYKLTYYGDGRYFTVFPKTPSDGRSGKNGAQQIIRSML